MKSRRPIGLGVGLAVLVLAAALALGELLVWAVSPTEFLYPRYQFSAQYGLMLFPNVVMVHGVPRKFEFRYTINHLQCRGEAIEPGASGLPAIVTLGDSYAFGMGVSDGEEFPAVMKRRLEGRADVVNLASPGWGLTQQIRRYYEMGVSYDPRIVVLQFCANDPDDNLANRVTRLDDGEFMFVNSANSLNWIKKYLSRSFVQRTQLYNFFRTRASRIVLGRLARHEESRLEASQPKSGVAGIPAIEKVYIELLNAFATRLRAEGRTLLVVSVDHQLEQFPHIDAAVHDLDARGALRYLEVLDWLGGLGAYASPEGHIWGAPAHEVIGEHLASAVGAALADSSAATSQ